jgi:hypothetical protein
MTLPSCPSIDDHHLVSKVSHLCWINGHTTFNVRQVIYWIRIDRHIMQILTFVCLMTIQLEPIISGVTPYLLTSMATICSTPTTIVVIKSEDL